MLPLHNAAVPIHTLPTEVLVKTFGRIWQCRRSLHLTSVCRRWHMICLSSFSISEIERHPRFRGRFDSSGDHGQLGVRDI
ncbi:hypothetical protein BD309DRAFT_975795 [Dichomitus squalens]|uniref:F-box domain-containing protein n=1 Tax=Dichomitus squalens TaxID=114155 RepID=A0A4Q9N848_9APHY|nr:hypothetical protein BD309DRAFT_975795 [Dichomitus squalens]TBU56520.1 hypothetical protein BD310DRAFT_931339 [Dichomitus squalens]